MREAGKKTEEHWLFIPEQNPRRGEGKGDRLKDVGGVTSEATEICCLEQKQKATLLKQKRAKVCAQRNSSLIRDTTIVCK